MDFIVCWKQVPETAAVKLNSGTGVLMRAQYQGIANPEDRHALEMAIQLKARHGGTIRVLTMAPENGGEILRQALAMGADEAYHITDPQLRGSDATVTARVLAKAIRKLGESPDRLVMLGRRSSDGATGMVGPALSLLLDLPLLTALGQVVIDQERVSAEQWLAGKLRQLAAMLPALLTITRQANTPRLPNAMQVMKAARKPLVVWSIADLGLTPANVGHDGSPTRVVRVFYPEKRPKAEIFTGDPEQVVAALNTRLGRFLHG
ncbi:MAG: electron transfer flavoprotein subunit beta/FixA family protein [Cyanobacteria bacterium NC_groundwater_1444_Ag_S-0.65um_54_12]|nr:electron transfer flavoprotein subunit beta/FixA family protein [Cyanobacteria bacterium NC_groundwater_1444_Ag_S-0.65um_54_12]